MANVRLELSAFKYTANHLSLFFLQMQGVKVRPTPGFPTCHKFEVNTLYEFFFF